MRITYPHAHNLSAWGVLDPLERRDWGTCTRPSRYLFAPRPGVAGGRGRVTCIYDAQRDHICTLVGFEKAPALDYIYYGNGRRKPAEGTREEVNKLQRQFHEQPNLFKSDLITPAPGTKINRQPKPYNPIELE